MQRRCRAYLADGLLVASVMMFAMYAWGGRVLASNYGSGGYSSCSYQACAPSATPTTIKLSSGLTVSINLQDGQVIPAKGYVIIVTPLNGRGTTFKRADFYIDGILAHSQTPAEDGTVQWFWYPLNASSADIKIVVIGQNGETVTKEFQVIIAKSSVATTPPAIASPPSLLQQITATPGIIVQGAENYIRQLPPAVKNSLPYFVFLILCGDFLLLALQIRRELSESRALRTLLDREQQSEQLKKTFTELVSHYLRTPITIIAGALDLIGSIEAQSAPQVVSLRAIVSELNHKVESLVGQEASVDNGLVVSAARLPYTKPIWRQPLFYVPVICVGLVAFVFDYLAQHAGAFNVRQVNLVIQIVLFGSLVAMLYLVLRRLELHRRDVADTKRILQTEVEFNQSRDQLIDKAALELRGALGRLDGQIAQLNATPTQATILICKGQQQLHDVVTKFVVAQQLKGATSTAPPIVTQLSSVCAPATQALHDKAQAKGISIDIMQDVSFAIPNPDLLSLVIRTILDNAIEYSPPQEHIEIVGSQTGNTLSISITDHGPGIPENKKFALFQAFSKVEGAEVFSHKGMGFSLYLDKLIMAYLIGDIIIEAVRPQGTQVVLTLAVASLKT